MAILMDKLHQRRRVSTDYCAYCSK